MKEKNFRPDNSEEYMKRPAKLEPIRKSGKQRHTLYEGDIDEEEETEIDDYRHRESAYDYFDDTEEKPQA